MNALNTVFRELNRLVTHMDMKEWAVVTVCFVAVGVFCMRGYGSRELY